MKWLMRKCTQCSRYTLKDICPYCGSATRIPHPAKFSPDDKYAKYRAKGSEFASNTEAIAESVSD
ncbi:MAG TPA: RNA-protein complex protein Nop10 [Candidatus Bathyarchaeia archaeon]